MQGAYGMPKPPRRHSSAANRWQPVVEADQVAGGRFLCSSMSIVGLRQRETELLIQPVRIFGAQYPMRHSCECRMLQCSGDESFSQFPSTPRGQHEHVAKLCEGRPVPDDLGEPNLLTIRSIRAQRQGMRVLRSTTFRDRPFAQ